MPGGCFEQTSSSTYPNVLGLDYMKRMKKSTPEVHAKAERYIANGYQRLLTFEVAGNGFSWFGQAAHAVQIRFEGQGGLAYQVAGRYFVPWSEELTNEPLSISVAYDRTRLGQDEIATATAVVRNNLNKAANIVIVDLGIPPGFELLSEDLEACKTLRARRSEYRSLRSRLSRASGDYRIEPR